MTAAPSGRPRTDAGNGWSVERDGPSNWLVIDPQGRVVNAYATRRAALIVARSQTTSNPVWAP